MLPPPKRAVWLCAVFFASVPGHLSSQPTADIQRRVSDLAEQNQRLLEQVQQQRREIEALAEKVAELEQLARRPPVPEPSMVEVSPRAGMLASSSRPGGIILSGTGAVAYLDQPSGGRFPNKEFRVDEAKLFLDARITNNIFLFSELNILTREDHNENMRIGEFFVDFENLLGPRGRVNLRAGRFDIPFGEEYLVRDAIDAPLISHSLPDLWGIDEGIALFGNYRRLQYVVAVQNGGHSALRDFHPDKALTVRLATSPYPWLYMSASAMRTGRLDLQDVVSELWFGNGFIRPLTPAAANFWANLAEADVHFLWKQGHVKAFTGLLHYNDSDPGSDNKRDVYFSSVQGLVHLPQNLYAAARFSRIEAKQGFPLVGHGPFKARLYGNLTDELNRLSLGIGRTWGRDLLMKFEYTWDWGQETGGIKRNRENQLGSQLVVRF